MIEGVMGTTTISDLHGRLIRDTFGRKLSDADAFLVFALFHGFRVVLAGPVLTDRVGVQEVAALTQRVISESLASVWAGTADERSSPHYWYHRWNGDWGSYSHAERLSPEEQERLAQLQAALEKHPFVLTFEPEK